LDYIADGENGNPFSRALELFLYNYSSSTFEEKTELISAFPWFSWMRISKWFGRGVSKEITNFIPEGNLANHLFKGAGKLIDSPENRVLIQNISNGKVLVVDKFGKSWYRGIDAAGSGIYSYVQNGVVKGAGYTNFNEDELINHIIKAVGVK
jgi:hypothetical protein